LIELVPPQAVVVLLEPDKGVVVAADVSAVAQTTVAQTGRLTVHVDQLVPMVTKKTEGPPKDVASIPLTFSKGALEDFDVERVLVPYMEAIIMQTLAQLTTTMYQAKERKPESDVSGDGAFIGNFGVVIHLMTDKSPICLQTRSAVDFPAKTLSMFPYTTAIHAVDTPEAVKVRQSKGLHDSLTQYVECTVRGFAKKKGKGARKAEAADIEMRFLLVSPVLSQKRDTLSNVAPFWSVPRTYIAQNVNVVREALVCEVPTITAVGLTPAATAKWRFTVELPYIYNTGKIVKDTPIAMDGVVQAA